MRNMTAVLITFIFVFVLGTAALALVNWWERRYRRETPAPTEMTRVSRTDARAPPRRRDRTMCPRVGPDGLSTWPLASSGDATHHRSPFP